MNITITLNYRAEWGQTLCICGSGAEWGNKDESRAVEMTCIRPSLWIFRGEQDESVELVFWFLVKESGKVVRREWGNPHRLSWQSTVSFSVSARWQDPPPYHFLYSSAFSDCFFSHEYCTEVECFPRSLVLKVYCPYVPAGRELRICGTSDRFGNWNPDSALALIPCEYGRWQSVFDASLLENPEYYKFVIYDPATGKAEWEEGENRRLNKETDQSVEIVELEYRRADFRPKMAGTAIPVFSLRSEDGFGIGEFSDLKLLIDWACKTNQKVIQILPVNDTTISYSWEDSYPYNAISTYALHPVYLGLRDYPLKNKDLFESYRKRACQLNELKDLDYESVTKLKRSYLIDLFQESGRAVLESPEYGLFYKKNGEWLFPYACFSYFRDRSGTADPGGWGEYEVYDRVALEGKLMTDPLFRESVELSCFTQYLLHVQLTGIKEYGRRNGIILKGDIPIGISRDSVEAWVDPHLFNLDVQTGAPPDDFSFYGQNWGFPTYNWEEMAKDGYRWWIKRFRKMADYFDAYRIDHILGFFRIWEILLSSEQGLLGYFSPALPLSAEEIRSRGIGFDEERMTVPYIRESFLAEIFGEYTEEVIRMYLQPVSEGFRLKEENNTQSKIKDLWKGQSDDKSLRIRDGLYHLCNEVLFIRDRKDPSRFHPRITAQYTFSYNELDSQTKAAFNRLYDDFFYRRHSWFWRDGAMKKLPALISSTRMLVCGEDLGMVPESVPSVMSELQILSLEIERMPKKHDHLFNYLGELPYLSVCTTSTHDMSPIRAWWRENRDIIQRYYNEILNLSGPAPEDCTSDICLRILNNHLRSPALFVIFPLQDWLSGDDTLKRDNPEEERINIPANSRHYWRYRMHLTLEELNSAEEYNLRIRQMIERSGRT